MRSSLLYRLVAFPLLDPRMGSMPLGLARSIDFSSQGPAPGPNHGVILLVVIFARSAGGPKTWIGRQCLPADVWPGASRMACFSGPSWAADSLTSYNRGCFVWRVQGRCCQTQQQLSMDLS